VANREPLDAVEKRDLDGERRVVAEQVDPGLGGIEIKPEQHEHDRFRAFPCARAPALALALALALPADLPSRDDILISAFAVVAFSVIVLGLTAPLALRTLRVRPTKRRVTEHDLQ
jgi:hypothetical protein